MSDQGKPSTFVTVVGWVVLLFSAMGLLAGLMQSALVAFAFPSAPFNDADAADMPFGMRFLFANFRLFVFTLTAFWAIALAGSVAFLKHKPWGRQLLVGLFAIGAVVTAAIAVFQQVMMSQMFASAADMPADASAMMLIMRIGSAVFALAFVGAFTFIAIRLNSPRTRAEFGTL